MPRPPRAYLQRLRARSHAASSVRLVFILLLALVAAPPWSVLDNQCGLCPPTCPMHQHHTGPRDPRASHLGCHRSPASADHHDRGPAHRPIVACATCGGHAQLSATMLPPMILPTAHPQAVVLVVERALRLADAQHDRLADTPDTPPPIAA
jgi:hypothetical protein